MDLPYYIVTLEEQHEDEESNVYAVRGRGTYPGKGTYNEPLLWGDEGWCHHAADALNKVTP